MVEDSIELIHQDHALLVRESLDDVYAAFRDHGHIDPFIVVWPSRTVNFEGKKVNGMIPIQLPEDTRSWPRLIADTVKSTSAWCAALYEQRPNVIVVIFESPIGTSSWHIPIEDHGDVHALGDVSGVRVDTDYIGAVWRPTTPAGAVRAGSR